MKTIRDKWCDKEITDLDYIRHLEKENEILKEPKTCDGCKLEKSWSVTPQCSVCQPNGYFLYKPKANG